MSCLCFTANTAGSTISMSVTGSPTLGQNFQTSTDQVNWTTFTPGSTTITLASAGDKIYFKGDNPNGVNEGYSEFYTFVMTGIIAASGNIMSLIDDGACTCVTIPNDYCFCSLFRSCTSLTTPPELPATTLTFRCYEALFRYCTSLIKVPALPATELDIRKGQSFQWSFAYDYMFDGCTSLYISETQSIECPYEYKIPQNGNSNYTGTMNAMFNGCQGTRSGWNVEFNYNQRIYYTQNYPIGLIVVTATYNNQTIFTYIQQSNQLYNRITYEGVAKTSDNWLGTYTLNTNNKIMKSNLLVGTKLLPCANKVMKGNLVITSQAT